VAEHESAADEADVTSRRFGPTYAALASQLRAERERQGLTQRALARRIEGYSTSLCNWEKGRSVPGVASLAKWAAGLGLELALVPVGAGADVAELRAELAAANERADKAEAEAGQHLGVNLGLLGGRDAAVKRARKAEAERDEARARLAGLYVEWGVRFPNNQIEPCESETDAREWAAPDGPSGFGLTAVCREASNWRDAETADATRTALRATETSELQFEASAPATKLGGAQRGAQGLCESERNDETGTGR
jgi:transcriptional regulator with XRE-family HTH domain